MLIKVLELVKTYIIVSLAILGYFNNLITQTIATRVLGSKVELVYNAKERQYYIAIYYNATNHYHLFLITRLDSLQPVDLI